MHYANRLKALQKLNCLICHACKESCGLTYQILFLKYLRTSSFSKSSLVITVSIPEEFSGIQ